LTISHHLDDATLLAFASGNIGEAHGIVVASHLSLCATCREGLRNAESLGGGILVDQALEAVSDLRRAATLASLDSVVTPQPKRQKSKSDLPPALSRALGGISMAEVKWRRKAPGVAVCSVPLSKSTKTRLNLVTIGKGRAMPEHGHGGEELTLILKGSYTDRFGRFTPGDVADLDDDVEHQPIMDADEDCICLIATEVPTKYKTFWAKVFQPFVGI